MAADPDKTDPAQPVPADPFADVPVSMRWIVRRLAKEMPVFWDRATKAIITVVSLLIAADVVSPETVAAVLPVRWIHVVELIGVLTTLYTQGKGKT